MGALTAWSTIIYLLLVNALPTGKETPQQLLLLAASLWITNILVFALRYWRLDAGGPYQRDKRPGHSEGAFLFPDMSMKQRGSERSRTAWTGHLISLIICFWLQHQHSLFTDRRARAGEVGESLDEGHATPSLLIIALRARARRQYSRRMWRSLGICRERGERLTLSPAVAALSSLNVSCILTISAQTTLAGLLLLFREGRARLRQSSTGMEI